ncbi:MAG: NAD kinase [Candidatus Fermentimicrarchaeum limneticum]|uniref:NAD kinase n=1 Tax=Fermentimicrarchaeum limneticum TaxID=2795018 RepID=A0A7D6BT95_FERL1|nr:MAG: NAD kinase [Candidatus Fermentimicrarchaeum limneticum]
MRIRSAFVVPNPRKQWAVKLTKEVAELLVKHGIKLKKDGDALITLGGDGTLLYNKNRYRQPIFGIGNEKSFICQSTYRNWRKLLPRVLRSCRIDWRTMLQCEISGRVYENSLNEICIRSRDHRVIETSLSFLGRKVLLKSDGVLFSTPTGSTAYAYSCGAPQLHPRARKYEVVPISPYRRSFKPAVVPDSTECELTVLGSNADLVIDGQFIHKVKLNSKIRVRLSDRKLGLLLPAT